MAQRRHNKRWLKWVLFLVLIVAAAVVCYLVWDGYFRKKEIEGDDGDNVELVAVSEEEEKVSGAESVKHEEKIEKAKVEQYDGEDPNEAGGLTGAITYAGVSGEYLMIRVNIDQYLSGGRCNLVLERDGKAVFGEAAAIVDAAATATCEGFNVLLSELGEGGELRVVVNLESGDKIGMIEGRVEI